VRVVVSLKPYTRKVYAVNKNPIGSLGNIAEGVKEHAERFNPLRELKVKWGY
jgi:hypothetical protein